MRLAGALLVATACGSAPPAKPPPPPLKQTVKLATCEEVAVILRHRDPDQAGEDHTAIVEEVCVSDRWPASVRDCIATALQPRSCLDKLTSPQQRGYDAAIQRWVDDEEDVEVPEVPCEAVVDQPALFAPVVDANTPEREWLLDTRSRFLLDECDHGWSAEARACLGRVNTAEGITACLDAELVPSERIEINETLAKQAEVAAKMAASRKKPATIGCKQVVAAHYGDARWKDKLDGFPAAQRKKMIEGSRKRLAEACKQGAWSETLRACIVAGGEQACFQAERMGLAWGYPAAGTVTSVGLVDCDRYGVALERIARCDKIPESSRASLRRSFDEMKANIASRPASERERMAPGCITGLETVSAIARDAGC